MTTGATFEKEYESLAKDLAVKNPHAVPRITHVTVNVGVGKNRDDKSYVAAVRKDLAAITGQQPHERRARKAIAGFNVREGNVVSLRVTLRGSRMEEFVQRFVNVTLPRVRDFHGLKTSSLDGRGNLNVGLKEQLAFPEIQPESTDVVFGVQVTFSSTAEDNETGEALFRMLGFPLSTGEDEEDLAFDIRQGKKAES